MAESVTRHRRDPESTNRSNFTAHFERTPSQNQLGMEPTRGLDILGVRQLRSLLRTLRDAGRAALFSSHVLAEVEELADRIVVIHGGRVVAVENPATLRGSASSLEEAVTTLTEAAA